MGHKVLELDKKVSEIRIELPLFGATIVGVVDYSDKGEIVDFKFTSVYSVIFADDKTEWEEQLQVYRHLVQLTGKPVKKISNHLILRDWKKREAQKSNDYPNIPFKEISYTPWERGKIEAYLRGRVELHLLAEKSVPDPSQCTELAFMCTPKQRWAKPDKWAVKKVGVEKAVRVFEKEDTADEVRLKEENRTGKKHFVEFRKGEDTKCLYFCSVSSFCPHWKKEIIP
jgi:hypothetical protein